MCCLAIMKGNTTQQTPKQATKYAYGRRKRRQNMRLLSLSKGVKKSTDTNSIKTKSFKCEDSEVRPSASQLKLSQKPAEKTSTGRNLSYIHYI